MAVTDQGHTSNSSGATLILTISTNAAVGDIMVVTTHETSAASFSTGGSMTDSGGNTYTSITHASDNNVANGPHLQIWQSVLTTALTGSSSTITFTKQVSGAVTSMSAGSATGYSGIDAAVTNTATGSSTTPSVTSGTPAVANETFFYAIGWNNNRTFTQDSGNGWAAPFTADTTQGANRIAGGSLINSGTGTKTASPTFNISAAWAMIIVGLNPAAFSKSVLINQSVKRAAYW